MAKTVEAVEAKDGIRWRGSAELVPMLVPMDDIDEDPENTNTHDERSLASIAAAYARFGQQKPVVVDGDGLVRAGTGQLLAARRLGWNHLAVVRSDLAGVEIQAYAIADNRTAEFSEWDYDGLARMMRAMIADGSDVSALGFDADEIDLVCSGTPVGRDGLPPDADGKEYDESIADQVTFCECPKCGCRFPR